nr:acetate/propionate family kinase [Bosea sp. ASV33]
MPIALTFNPGSSSIKLGVFALDGDRPIRLGHGEIDLSDEPLVLHLVENGKATATPLSASPGGDLHAVIDEMLGLLTRRFALAEIAVAGHRVVHGGDRFTGPTLITPETLAAIEALVPLDPLHQPQSIRLIKAIAHLRPQIRQTASFDTAFHRSQSDLVRRFALPRALFDQGIKHFGFHGLSYAFVAGELSRLYPDVAKGRVVVAHLGAGASMCALEAGVSRDTTMSFSTLDGVPMATRCGTLDPGVVIHLVKQRGWSIARVEDMLYHRSGLFGMSEISGDTRMLCASDDPRAKDALDLFAFRVSREVAALANTLGGLDGLVFTAGIGEHQPTIRDAICRRLGWLGAMVDPAANAANLPRIDSKAGKIAILVVATDEEQVIADEAHALLGQGHLVPHATA